MKGILIAMIFCVSSLASASEYSTVESNYSFEETVSKLEKVIKEKGLIHFKSIAHHEGAKKVGMSLNPTTLIIFGNPRVGSQLMKDDQLMGIELPMKFLVHQDTKGSVKVSYKKPVSFKKAYKLRKKDTLLGKISSVLKSITANVTSKKSM